MNPIDFVEANKTLTKPLSMTDEECGSLSVWNDGKQSVSCWRPTLRERLSILIFGCVWLTVLSGETQPPVALSGKRKIFDADNKNIAKGMTMLESLVPKLMEIKGWNATKLMRVTGLSWGVSFDLSKGVVPKSAFTLDILCETFECQPNDIYVHIKESE